MQRGWMLESAYALFGDLTEEQARIYLDFEDQVEQTKQQTMFNVFCENDPDLMERVKTGGLYTGDKA